MLALTRREGEVILIGDPTIALLRVVRIRGDRVVISVDAAPEVRIDRAEIRVRRAYLRRVGCSARMQPAPGSARGEAWCAGE